MIKCRVKFALTETSDAGSKGIHSRLKRRYRERYGYRERLAEWFMEIYRYEFMHDHDQWERW